MQAGDFSRYASSLQLERDFAPLRAIANFCLPYGFDARLAVPSREPGLESFSDSIGIAEKAQGEFERARETVQPFEATKVFVEKGSAIFTLKALLKNTGIMGDFSPASFIPLNPPILAAIGFSGAVFLLWELNECNQKAHSALARSIESASLGLAELDKAASDFGQLMGGEEISGPAGDAKMELAEIKHDAATGNAGGKSLGAKIAIASQNIAEISRKLRNDARYWPDELPQTIFLLVSADGSVLSEEMRVARKIADAIKSLENRKKTLEGETLRQRKLAQGALRELKREGIGEISEEALLLAFERAQSVSAATSAGGFPNRIGAMEREESEAGGEEEFAQSLGKNKPAGWLAKSISALEKARALYARGESDGKEILGDALWLEKTLAEKTRAKESQLREKIAKASDSDAAMAANFAKNLEQEKQKTALQIPLGGRINSLAQKFSRLNELEKELDLKAPNSLKLQRLFAQLDSATKLAQIARREDGLDTAFEQSQLAEIGEGLQNLKLLNSTNASAMLEYFETRITGAENSVVSKASAEYKLELESARERLLQLRNFLNAPELQKLSSFARFFPFGSLDAKKAAGSLGQMRVEFAAMLSSLEAGAKNVLQKHLQDGLEVQTSVAFAEPGVAQEVFAVIHTKNSLPLPYGGLIELELPLRLPSEFETIRSTDGAQLVRAQKGARLLLSGVSEGSEFEVQARFNKVFSRIVSESEETVFASEKSARKKISIEYDADFSEEENGGKPLLVLIKKEFAFPVETIVSSILPFEKTQKSAGEKTQLLLLVHSRPGKNKAEIDYEFEEPFEKTITPAFFNNTDALGENTTLVKYSVSYKNKYADLEGAKILFSAPVQCETGKSAFQSADLDAEKISGEGKALEAILDAGKKTWSAGQSKSASIIAECKNPVQTEAGVLGPVLQQTQIPPSATSGGLLPTTSLPQVPIQPALPMQISELEKTAALASTIADASKGEQYSPELLAVAQNAREKQEIALALAAQGKIDEAKSIARAALSETGKSLEETALSALRAIEDECKKTPASCDASVLQKTRDARAALAAEKFEKAFSNARDAEGMRAEFKETFEKGLAEKNSVLQKFRAMRTRAIDAVNSFDVAFGAPFGASPVALAKRRETPYQTALDAKNLLQKKVSELDALVEKSKSQVPAQQEAFAKIIPEEISKKQSELEGAQASLDSALEQMRKQASGELLLARQMHGQFGNQTSAGQLEQAGRLLAEGKTFAAFLEAGTVSGNLQKSALSAQTGLVVAKAQEGQDKQFLFAAIGAIILGLLAFLFFRKPGGKKEEQPGFPI